MCRIPRNIVNIIRMAAREKRGGSCFHLTKNEALLLLVEHQTYALLWRPDPCDLVNPNRCQFPSITIPRDVSHSLWAGHAIVSGLECGKRRRLYREIHEYCSEERNLHEFQSSVGGGVLFPTWTPLAANVV